MKKSFSVLLAVVLSLFATNSFAENYYFSGSGGLTVLLDSDFDVSGQGVSGSGKISFDKGWNAGGAIGYDFGTFRTDFEIRYRYNEMDSFKILSITEPVDDQISALSYLLNGYIDLENESAWTPYIGVGMGMAHLKIKEDSDSVFAYKFTVGIDYSVTPEFSLTTDYSFLGTSAPSFEDQGVSLDTEYHTHNFNAGLKYNF